MAWHFYMWLVRLLLALVLVDATGVPGAAAALVGRSDLWHLHKGTNEPQANWRVTSDAELNGEWSVQPGGFGYGDPAITNEATILSDMPGRYSTLYIRRFFDVPSPLPANARLRFWIDYDDAYIAYLDGVEIARSANAPLGEPSSSALARFRHEASCCDAPLNPATTLDLGLAAARLNTGPHVLAVRGFNDELNSSDFHLIAELSVVGPEGCPPNTICEDTVWTAADGVKVVRTNLAVGAGATLRIEAGAQVRLATNVSIIAGPHARIEVAGTASAPVTFATVDGLGVFGELAADGDSSALTIRHADVAGGAVSFRNGATGLMEDCYVHHFKNGTIPIAGCDRAQSMVVRRCHFNVYHETLWRYTPTLIEDSLFENANNVNSDALDFDGAPPGSTIRRCTFRHGPETNTDAIDLGTDSLGVIVEDCLMFNFPNDKGVSVGEDTFDVIIRNCLVYGCDSGVAVKDNCTATIYNCTFVQNDYGFRNFNKAIPTATNGGGHILESYNNILWDNTNTISLLNGSTALADHSTFSGVVFPGLGMISADPGFVAPELRDYRLGKASAVAGAGRNGASLGARFPVGAPMAASHPSFQAIEQGSHGVIVRFWADSEKSYTLQSRPHVDSGAWQTRATYPKRSRPELMEFSLPASSGAEYLQLLAHP